jgi:hypothetical protein
MMELLRTAGHAVSIGAVRQDYVRLGISAVAVRTLLNLAARAGIVPRSAAAAIVPTPLQQALTLLTVNPAAATAPVQSALAGFLHAQQTASNPQS